jgi:hypothetical protein
VNAETDSSLIQNGRSVQEAMARAYTEGWTRWGPTIPRLVWDMPEWDETQTPEWKALYDIAESGDEDAADTAIRVIGTSRWTPGPPPGYVPSLIEISRSLRATP